MDKSKPLSTSLPSRPVAASPRPATAAPAAGGSPRQVIMDALKRIDTGTREFEYNAQDFERVRSLIYKRAGISLSPVKQDMVYSRLARRLRAKGLKRFSEYLDQLERGQDAAEWEAFVNALTTNLTSFFREAHHFDLLAEQMRKSSDRRPFRIWCCAASTGEEPYSLAITACEVFGNNPPVEILASDLDTNVLAHGQRGVYTADRVERMEAARVQRFFLRGTGDQQGHVRVKPELQRLLTFRQINLLAPGWPLREGFDAIFCRNVMIYFDKPTQYGILERFAGLLHPQGRLYAGHSENFIHAANLFRSLGRTVYARTEAGKSGH
jgi:chemotaxis protein methyltransferase CheR